MVIPSGPRNARALLAAAIRDPDPVVFFEPKALYHAAKEEVPDEIEAMPSGGRRSCARATTSRGRLRRDAAAWRSKRPRRPAEDGVAPRGHRSADGLAARPRDAAASVEKTGRGVIVHEAPRRFGPGAEIAASIMDGAFLSLEAPIRRVTANDVPSPASPARRRNVPDVPRVVAAARETLRVLAMARAVRAARPRRGADRGRDPQGARRRGRRDRRRRAAARGRDRQGARSRFRRRSRGRVDKVHVRPGPDREGRRRCS